MSIQALGSTTPNTNTQQSMTGLTGDSFLVLLTAQLKSQDPTQPTDPTAFVGQLVQFNSLEQLIQINQNLAGALSPQAAAGQPPAQPPAHSAAQAAMQLATQIATQTATQNAAIQGQTSQFSLLA